MHALAALHRWPLEYADHLVPLNNVPRCLAPVALVDHWRNSGVHYALTAEGWLQNMDANASEVREILKEAYPPGETELWFHRWRAFYLACVELFGYDGGQEWCIGHYLFEKR